MLIEFNVANYRSIYDKITFSLEATSVNEHEDHVAETSHLRILKTSAMYGANASGKSNILKALAFMKDMVLNSSKESQFGEQIKAEPFLLNSHATIEPSEFEVTFLNHDALYRYGFTFDKQKIFQEWLYIRKTKPRAKEIKQFERDGSQIVYIHKDFKEAKRSIRELLKVNTLFLSLLSQFNGEKATRVTKCFLDTNLWISDAFEPVLTHSLMQKNMVPKDWVTQFLLKADVGIKGFEVKEKEWDMLKLKDVLPESTIQKSGISRFVHLNFATLHEYYDSEAKENRSVWFDMNTQESDGTKKFFSLAGLLYHTLRIGGSLFIDEIEGSLHPLLCRIIIRLFQDKETNPQNAQLVFTTHNTSFLDKSYLRRDEIWFVEKNTHNSTALYSLVEYKLPSGKARNDASYSKDYLRGKYGALPFVEYSDFATLLKRS